MRLAAAVSVLAVAFAYALRAQLHVAEIHRADRELNFPLALARPTSQDWPGFRGGDGLGISGWDGSPFDATATGTQRWQVAVPGGSGGPCVWGDLIVVPSADAARSAVSLAAYHRADGRLLWQRDLLTQIPLDPSPIRVPAVPACDGQAIFLGVVVDQRLLVCAVDLQGGLLWTTDAGPQRAETGRLISPRVAGSLVIVAADHEPASYLSAVHRQHGSVVWRVRTPQRESSVPPVLADGEGISHLILPGPGDIRAYDPCTGDALWHCRWTATGSGQTVAAHYRHVYVAAREPRPMIVALRQGGSGDVTASHVLWQNEISAGVSSIAAVHRETLLGLSEDGVLSCLDRGTGKLQWQRQLPGSYAAQPILGGDRLLCVNTAGTAIVVDLEKRGEIVCEQSLRESVHAPFAVTQSALIVRTATSLICLPWEKPPAPLVNQPKDHPKRL